MASKNIRAILFFLIVCVSIARADSQDNYSARNNNAAKDQAGLVEAPATDSQPMFKFDMFGTLGVLHSTQTTGDYVLESSMPYGAGRNNEWDFNNYSKIAAQLNGYFTPKISGQFQVVSAYLSDGSFTPEIEWLNLKYSINRDVFIRVGRIGLPTFFDSGNHDVGYTYTWAHPPSELYYLLPIQSSDGIDAMYRFTVGEAQNSIKIFYGQNTHDGSYISTKSNGMWGIFDFVEYGEATFHAGYQQRNTTTTIIQSGVSDGGVNTTNISFGVNYEPGDWFFTSEWIQKQSSYTSNAMYAAAGYHFNQITPFLVHGQNTTGSLPQGYEPETNGFDFRPIANRAQQTDSIGVRWDFRKNYDLKFQYDQVTLSSNSNGFLINVPANTNLYGSSFSLISAVLDFAF